MTWRKGLIEERTHGGMDTSKKWMIHTTPNHHPAKKDVLPKTFLQIILAAKWLGGIQVHPSNSSDDLCLLFCLILLLWTGLSLPWAWQGCRRLRNLPGSWSCSHSPRSRRRRRSRSSRSSRWRRTARTVWGISLCNLLFSYHFLIKKTPKIF